MTGRDIEPDAIKIKCVNHCQKQGVNLYENGQHIGDRYGDGYRRNTFKGTIGCNVEREPLFSAETIQRACKFESKARDIEYTARKLEAAIQGTINREEVIELIGVFQNHADNIAKLKDVFDSDE